MIHIRKAANGEFYVTVTAANAEVLSTSETFKSEQSAWKNIYAMAKAFKAPLFLKVSDESLKKPINYRFYPANNSKLKA